jgi:hypothetical protein
MDGASSRPLSRMAAEIGMDLDSDEDDFLFGGGEDEMVSARPRSKSSVSRVAPDVLVLDDDEDDSRREHSPAHQRQSTGAEDRGTVAKAKGSRSKGKHAGETANGTGEVMFVDAELEEQSSALRALLSGLVVRDTLADVCKSPPSKGSPTNKERAYFGAAAASLDPAGAHDSQVASASASTTAAAAMPARRVSLGRHRGLIQQARSAQQGEDADAENTSTRDAATPRSGGGAVAVASSVSLPSTRAGPLRASPPAVPASSGADEVLAVGTARGALVIGGVSATLAVADRGPRRGLASVGPAAGTPSAPSSSVTTRPAILRRGVGASPAVALASPPTPPSAPRRSLGSAGERLRPMYARPSASAASIAARNEA